MSPDLRLLESNRVHSLEHYLIKETEEVEDQDIKKIKELLTIFYEILGEDFLNSKDIDKDYKKLLDMDFKNTIKGKFKTHIFQNPTH